MNRLKDWAQRLPLLLVLTLCGIGLAMALIFPLSHHIREVSVSAADNFAKTAWFMGLLVAAAAVQTLLVSRLLWGPNVWGGVPAGTATPEGASTDEPPISLGHLKATGSKIVFIFLALLLVLVVVFDALGQGALVFRMRKWAAMAELRATDAATRRSGAETSVYFTGDEDFTRALGRIIEQPGAGREWAALAAGARIDSVLSDALENLAFTGNAEERAAALGALARIGDGRLVRAAISAWPHLGAHRSDALLSLALVGKNMRVFSPQDLEDAGQFVVDVIESGELERDLLHQAIFALNRLETPLGLPWLEAHLEADTETDVQTLCLILGALGNIGAADSSPKMIAFFDRHDREAACEEAVAFDFSKKQALLSTNASLAARTLAEIARIGDTRAYPHMRRISQDTTLPESVRAMAAEIAAQLSTRVGATDTSL
ncbi:MAG: hypothetical protein M0R76_09055 [Proteobacteria bacterium]|nr:hypothetical protein [Pseudomonadota bacterium]